MKTTKKLGITLLLLLALLPAARGEEYPGYALEESVFSLNINPINDREFLSTGWSDPEGSTDRFWHVTWWKDRRVFRDLPYSPGGALRALSSADFLVDGQGNFRVMVFSPIGEEDGAASGRRTRCDLFEWTEKGLVNPHPVPTLPDADACRSTWARAFGPYAVAEWRGADAHRLFIYDLDARLQAALDVPLNRNHQLLHITETEAGVFLAEFRSVRLDPARYTLLCLDAKGVRWKKEYKDTVGIRADGRGGAVLTVNQKGSSYAPYDVVLVDRDGRETARKQLSGSRVVVGLGAPQWDEATRTYTFHGPAVANSRRYYTVYRLVTDEGLNPVAWDVRALSGAYGDYSPDIFRTPEGGVFVFTRSISQGGFTGACALVPFDALPTAQSPGLTLK